MAKVDRKQLLNQPDEFLTASDKAVKWAQENLKTVIIVLSIIVVALALVVGWQIYGDYRTRVAADALAPAMTDFAKALSASSDDKATQAAEKALVKVMDDYGSTPSGRQARFALGSLELEHGRWDKALETFQRLTGDKDLAPELLPLAWRGKAQALEGLKKYQDSAQAYAKAAELSGPNLAASFRMSQARALAEGGDKSGAEAIYREIIEKGKDPVNVQVAKELLAVMGVTPPEAAK